MRYLRAVTVIVGAVVGAGFLSGVELVKFFPSEQFFLALSLFLFLLLFEVLFALKIGQRYGGFQGAIEGIFPRRAPVVYFVFFLSSLLSCASMMAGMDGFFPSFSPFGSLCSCALALLALKWGARGISTLSSLLTPVVLVFLLVKGSGALSFSYPIFTGSGLFKGALYAGYNGFLSFPVLCEMGKNLKKRARTVCSFVAILLIGWCAAVVLGKVFREGANALLSPLPFLYAMKGSKFFSVASGMALFVCLAQSGFTLLSACERLPVKKTAAKGVSLAAAFALSRVGFNTLAGSFYPVLGSFGLMFSAFCIFHEEFFQKHHKKVHRGGKNAQNAGRAHHQVQLKHLPAVHDKIP